MSHSEWGVWGWRVKKERELALFRAPFLSFYDVFVFELYKQIKTKKFIFFEAIFLRKGEERMGSGAEGLRLSWFQREWKKIDISFRSSGVRLEQQLIPV